MPLYTRDTEGNMNKHKKTTYKERNNYQAGANLCEKKDCINNGPDCQSSCRLGGGYRNYQQPVDNLLTK